MYKYYLIKQPLSYFCVYILNLKIFLTKKKQHINSMFWMLRALLFSLILFCAPNFMAQSPQVNCLVVAPNGDVSITWSPTSNLAAVFVQYNVYVDNGSGFSQVTSINNLNTTTYTQSGAGANLSATDYYVTVVYDNGSVDVELPPLDTLSTIYLNVSNPTDGTAILQWNDMLTPMPSVMGEYFYIWQQQDAGAYVLIDSVLFSEQNYYRDTISICSAQLNYEIRVNHDDGCVSSSNIDGDLFQDLIAPLPPVITSVSVDSISGNATITWEPSVSGDASAYIILNNYNGGWLIVDTVYGHNNTFYQYNNSFAGLISEQFGIAAFDSCWSGMPSAPNTSPMGTPHRTIFATTSYDVCELSTTLKWNKYLNWQGSNGGVSSYEIFSSVANAPATQIGVTSGLDTAFTDAYQNTEENYCYIVRAISADFQDTALSNITCRFTRQPPKPQYAYLALATVEDSDVKLKFNPDLTGITSEIEVFKSEDNGVSYSSFYTETSISTTMIVADTDVKTEEQSYRYRVNIKDSCHNIALTSNIAQTIHLRVDANVTTLTNLLQWTPYKNWNGNLVEYRIYRSINGTFSSAPIAILPPNQYYFEDDISQLLGTLANGTFCYRVEAKESLNTYGRSEISASNEACANQDPIVYIPNAMSITGYNDTWSPVVNLLDYSSYKVNVYNRLGQSIFETSDPHSAWDGTHKGKAVPLGVYVYQVTFEKGSNEFVDLRGTITVVR